MFPSSINNRLWLSYLLILIFVLLIAFVGIAVAFRNSPMLYRQEFYRISLVNGFLRERLAFVGSEGWDAIIRLFLEDVQIFNVDIAIVDGRGKLGYATASDVFYDLPWLRDISSIIRNERLDQIFQFKTSSNNWFYQVSRINQNYYLVTSTLRPTISISSVFQDELMKPLIQAGAIAFVLSFILAWFIARWITQPLHNIATSANQIADGNYLKVPIVGPLEVRQLATAINDMVTKVQDSIQSQKDFVANVSHEFKTPLTSIRGFSQAIYDGAIIERADEKRAAEIILGESERLNDLVNDLLILAKLDAGMVPMDKTLVDLNQLIENITERLKFQIDAAKIKLETDLQEPMSAFLDAERISQVLYNLIENAIKYSTQGKIVKISTCDKDGFLEISVTDSGPGIPEADQARIFERFYQIDESREGGQRRGVGLGLSIAYQIVAAHNGSLKVQSEPGYGSTFMVKLPKVHEQ
jgi:signal transduction histidine kinase